MSLFDLKLPVKLLNRLKLPLISPVSAQRRVLKKLLKKARFTQFGQDFGFDKLLLERKLEQKFQQAVPIFDYSSLNKAYWHKTLAGQPDVTWPGSVQFFALSSGTSEASSKFIPITKELIKANNLTSIRQLVSLAGYHDVNFSALPKGWLMLGGSTRLQKGPTYYAGDLSGIQQKNIPFWFQSLYKPGKKIARMRNWGKKIDEIVENAPKWDIGFIVGVPAWLQLCMEKIIERYQLNTIHDIWPNLSFYVHGGVAFEPYKKGFEKLLAKPITYIETYLASEGFLAYQNRQNAAGMRLAYNNNIFFEFVPFDEDHFDTDGNILPGAKACLLNGVQLHKDYAVLISTNAGAWRYQIGDTIRFVDLEKLEIRITGRTKHFLSLVGEHLSVDNMNKAIETVTEQLNISIPEFTVAGVPYGTFFAHHWYLACNDTNAQPERIREIIDETLHKINDDYAVERKHALKAVEVEILPEALFLEFMQSKKKIGAQHKFPRVMKGNMLEEWQLFLKSKH